MVSLVFFDAVILQLLGKWKWRMLWKCLQTQAWNNTHKSVSIKKTSAFFCVQKLYSIVKKKKKEPDQFVKISQEDWKKSVFHAKL